MTPIFSKEKPPIWDKLQKAFPYAVGAWGKGTLVCAYNGVIYHNAPVPPETVVHEMVHIERQLAYPGGPDAYVDKYIIDKKFRYQEELVAYRKQHQYIKEHYSESYRELAASDMAWSLSGPLYDCNVTYMKALIEIQMPVDN